MSRHIRAQTTPTHASGFHLFTVAMTGHAKDKGVQLPQQVTICRCCPNAVKESRSEKVGFYRNEQGGFCLPGTSEDCIALHLCHRTHRRNASIERGQLPATEKETQSMQCTI